MRTSLAWLCFLVTCHAASGASAADADDSHADIDRAYQACLDRAGTTAAQLACVDQAYGAWDKVLNETYKAALAGLSPANQELLREAQRKWLAYRDADSRFQAADWTFGQGTFFRVVLADASLQIVKARALVLDSYVSPGDR